MISWSDWSIWEPRSLVIISYIDYIIGTSFVNPVYQLLLVTSWPLIQEHYQQYALELMLKQLVANIAFAVHRFLGLGYIPAPGKVAIESAWGVTISVQLDSNQGYIVTNLATL